MSVDNDCALCVHRAAQYACALLGSTLQNDEAAQIRRTVSQLEAHMSLTRKCE